jgi:hypothetical protein
VERVTVAGLPPGRPPLEGRFTYLEMIALGQYVQDLPVLSGLPPCESEQEARRPGDCALSPESLFYGLGFEGGDIPLAGVPPDYDPDAVPDGALCVAMWSNLGMQAEFYPPAQGSDPCDPSEGALSHVTLTDPRWRTSAGLGIGDSATELRALYPENHRHRGPSRWGFSGHWFIFAGEVDTATVPVYRIADEYPPGLLIAKLKAGRVSSFVVRFAGGPPPPTSER